MKQPPATATRVEHDVLKRFVDQAAQALGLSADRAALLARLLVANDLRGVLSHGSLLIARYAWEIRNGGINAASKVRVVQEGPTSLVLDGDGGLGYFPAYEGATQIIEKARQQGMAALVTQNHGHIGAAGIYTRLAVKDDMIAFMTSGVKLNLQPGDPVYKAAGASPFSFSAPTGEAPPFVLDAGVMHDLQGANSPHRDELAALTPGLVLRAIGYGTVCQVWGGLLAGLSMTEAPAYASATQGAMLFACRVSLFADVATFKREMDAYARQVRELKPIAGTEGAFLPGGVEAEREKVYREQGIPLSEQHQQALEKLSDELGLAVPWR